MSKGPGKLQRTILLKLASREAFNLQELLGLSFSKAEYNALLIAMQSLEAKRKINVQRFAFGGGGTIYVHRIGTTFTGDDRYQYEAYNKRW